MKSIHTQSRSTQPMKTPYVRAAGLALAALFAPVPNLAAQGTAFTYQGRLHDSAGPANGTYNLRFALFDALTVGNQVGALLTNAPVNVSNGLFTATLDFGANAFTGPARWLEIGVRTNGGSAFNPLTPRQPATPTPYAIYAESASASQLSGTIRSSNIGLGAITSAQLADTISLGASNVLGHLDIYSTTAGTPALSLDGASSTLSLFGNGGLARARWGGPRWGEISLYDEVGRGLTAHLSANANGGGLFDLNASNNAPRVQLNGTNLQGQLRFFDNNNLLSADFQGNNLSFFNGLSNQSVWLNGGNVGILALNHLSGGSRVLLNAAGPGNGGAMYLYNRTGATTLELQGSEDSTSGSRILMHQANGTLTLALDAEVGAGGGGYLDLRNSAGVPTITLQADVGGEGRVITQALQITGGADLSEKFEIAATRETAPEPGMIVCIDPDETGRLVVSSRACDRSVAGIVSGAGGVKPGMLMGQVGTVADGRHPVALSGRVYCWMDAGHGAIQRGDLITTSPTPGHGMRVSDYQKAHGAIIGKAMSSLEKGRGLVLVLVSLQ